MIVNGDTISTAVAYNAKATLRGVLLLYIMVALTGCFYISPIEEEDPEVDYPPVIDKLHGISPELGYVTINLSEGGRQQFVVSQYDDVNIEQPLYHRNVIDYRPAGITSNPITATLPDKIEAGSRNPIRYEFVACSSPFQNAIKPGKTVILYILLSDDIFSDYKQSYSDKDHLKPFATANEREPIWVSWTLQFIGECP